MSGGGGGGPTQTTNVNTNVPEYAKPYVMNMLGATQNQLFNTTPGKDGQPGEITGFKPYTPYSTDPTAYFAGPSGLQQQVYGEAARMQGPSQFAPATGIAGLAGMRQLGAGQQYARQVTDPNVVSAYMSPYQQSVTDVAKQAAVREAQIANNAANLASARSGTYGGARQALAQAERERGLLANLSNIQAQGAQSAYDRAIQAQQFGANLGLQGLSGAGQTAATLGNLGSAQQQADLARMGFQQQTGAQQQQYQQNIINQAVQDYATAQQYPMMQLGFMSNMLRGLPMQSTSTQMYQAAPSALSQLGGLGATALGAYGASGGFRAAKGGVVPGYKEGGSVQHYDIGGSVEAQLADMPDAKLAEIAKTSPSQEIRKIAAKLLMEHRLEAQAQQQSGLAAAPAPNLDNMDGMAGGGIVAFAGKDESLVRGDDTYDENLKQLSGQDLRRAQIQYAMDNAKNPLAVLNPGELWSGFKSFLANPENQNAAKRLLASEGSPVAQGLPAIPVKTSTSTASSPAATTTTSASAPTTSSTTTAGDNVGIPAAGKYDARIEKLFADLEAKSPTAGLAQEDLNKLRAEAEANKDKKLWQALMMGGAKAMAGKSQYALSNIGEGIAGGVEDYVKSEAGERADKKLLIAQQSALDQAEYARKTGNLNALVAAQARLDNVKLQTMALALQRQGITDSKLQSAITARAKLILGNNAMPSPQEVDDAINAATAQVTGKGAAGVEVPKGVTVKKVG